MDVPRKNRLLYLDWVRGFAALIMLQGHVFHSFLRNDLRESGPYQLSQFVGGMPPAIFLFLTGVTLAFLMTSLERKLVPPGKRVLAGLRRAAYLFGIAFLFRIQLWVFALPNSPWTDLLRVDILNCMGLAICVIAPMAVFRTAERIRFAAIAGLGIAAASPVVSMVDWSGLPQVVRDYLVPNPNFFSFFPWASFLAFGLSAGSILRRLESEQVERAMQWGALLGCGLIMASRYFSEFPYSVYPKSDFWLNSPHLILIKLGVILLMISFAFLWTRHSEESWSWIRQFGVTSLLIYWVHIELVYGRWLWFWKESLTIGQTVAAAVGVILLMLALSTAKSYRNRFGSVLSSLKWFPSPRPNRVPGD
jgi:uncharacterized membrane protein